MPDETTPTHVAPPPNPTNGSGIRWLAWIAIIIAIIAIIIAGLLWHHASNNQLNTSELEQRVKQLANQVGLIDQQNISNKIASLSSSVEALQHTIDQGQTGSTSSLNNVSDQLKQLTNYQHDNQQNIQEIQKQINQLQIRIKANQHNPTLTQRATLWQTLLWAQAADVNLQLTRDTHRSILLLQTALQGLQQEQPQHLAAIKKNIASDIARLQNAPQPNVPNILGTLNSIGTQVSQLPILPPSSLTPNKKPNTPENIQEKKDRWHSVKASLGNIKKLFVIRRVDQSDHSALQPGQLALLRENILQKIEQAAWAVMHRKPALYTSSLNIARDQLQRNFLFNENQTKNIIAQIDQLKNIPINPTLPSIQPTLDLITHTQQQLREHSPHQTTPDVLPGAPTSRPAASVQTTPSTAHPPLLPMRPAPSTMPPVHKKPAPSTNTGQSTPPTHQLPKAHTQPAAPSSGTGTPAHQLPAAPHKTPLNTSGHIIIPPPQSIAL